MRVRITLSNKEKKEFFDYEKILESITALDHDSKRKANIKLHPDAEEYKLREWKAIDVKLGSYIQFGNQLEKGHRVVKLELV